MTAGTYLAGVAACVAAVLSGTSLILTRRWQQRDTNQRRQWEERDLDEQRRSAQRAWILDALKQPLTDHINMSFKIGRACNDGVVAAHNGQADLHEAAFDRAVGLHTEYIDLMLYLRLLGTPSLVLAAERLHRDLDILLDLSFAEDLTRTRRRPFTRGRFPEDATVESTRVACRSDREALINEARGYLDLPKDAVIDRSI